jgi:general stress protein 26
MANRLELVEKYLASLRSASGGAAAPQADLLAEDAGMVSLNFTLSGRNAVLERMAGPDSGKIFREVTWSKPEPFGPSGEQVRIIGRMPNGVGAALVFHFKGNQISLIQHQAITGGARPPTDLKLPAEVKELVNRALATNHPIAVAHTDENGQPVMSFRGSTQVFSDDQLAIWVRHSDGRFIQAIQKNPKLALVYRDNDKKATYMFQGRARVANDPNIRKQVYDNSPEPERKHDFALLGTPVIIDLDSVEGFASLGPNGPVNPIRMQRGAGAR